MSLLPQFFTTRHQLREVAVLDQGSESSLFLVEKPNGEQLLVELFNSQTRGAVREAQNGNQPQQRYIAPLDGGGTTDEGQEFLVRRSMPGEQLSNFTASGVGARHLSPREAQLVFGALAQSVDFLLERGQAGYALRALNPRRIVLTSNRSSAYFAAVGPVAHDASSEEVIDRFAQLVSAACPSFRNGGNYSSATAVVEALRTGPTQQPQGFGQAQQQAQPQPQTQPQAPQQHMPQQQQQNSFGHPQQQMPQQGYGQQQYYAQQEQQPQDQQLQGTAEPAKKKSKTPLIVGSILGVLVLIAVAAAAYFFLFKPSWSDEEQKLAEAYPELVSDRPDGQAFADAKCSSREPEEGQTAKITCVGEDFSYSVAGYEDADQRAAAGPDTEGEKLSNGQCTMHKYTVSEDDNTYYLAVEDSPNALLVWGEAASEQLYTLPVC